MNKESDLVADSDKTIVVTFDYDRGLSRRAMTAWWQSVVPPEPFIKRAIIWACIWFGILLIALAVSAFGLSAWLVGAGLMGAGVMVGSFAFLQRTRMNRFWDEIGRHWQKAGQTRVEFSNQGLTVNDNVETRVQTWPGIDAVRPLRGATVFRSGISMLVIPDSALPSSMTPKMFREQIDEWRDS